MLHVSNVCVLIMQRVSDSYALLILRVSDMCALLSAGLYREGKNWEEPKFGMAKFGATKVCQIMPWYFKVQSHFSSVIFSALGIHISICPTASIQNPKGNESNHPSNHLEASKKQLQPTKGSQEITTVYACSCATVWEFGTNFCSGISELASNFLQTKFRHSKSRTFLISASPV